MFKKLILSGIILIGLSGCSVNNASMKTISEVHKIYEIDKYGFVHGELVKGHGEGIYYSKEQLKDAGVKNVKVGNIIRFTWTKRDYEHENWDKFSAKKVD